MAIPVPKFLAIAFFCFLLLPVSKASAQGDALLYKEIQLREKSYTFDELTHVIQKQAGITFTYNSAQIKGRQHFRIKNERITVVKLLALIKKKSGIGYRMVNPGMIIYTPPVSRHKPNKKKKKIAKKETETQDRKIPFKTVSKDKTASKNTESNTIDSKEQLTTSVTPEDSLPSQTVVVIGDSTIASSYYLGGAGSGGEGRMGNIKMVMRYPSSNENTINPYASLNPPGSKVNTYRSSFNQPDVGGFIKKNLVLGAGISFNETYYLNPTLQFGFRFLYAHISYSMGAFPQWRYGLGAEARLNEKWSARLEFSTGNRFHKTYSFTTYDTVIPPPPEDSLTPPSPPIITAHNNPLTVQSQLTQFSFTLNRQITKVISLGGGITLNKLKSRYYSNGTSIDINSIDPPVANAEEQFRTIKPPYLLSDSYQAASAINVKFWIGLKVALFFNLGS